MDKNREIARLAISIAMQRAGRDYSHVTEAEIEAAVDKLLAKDDWETFRWFNPSYPSAAIH